MSKMDAVRAMREARYAEAQARSRAKPVPADDPAAAEGLCGHRNMSGRTCTREQGHSAKSHRYG